MAASTVVIKVKYGDMLRRFNAKVVNEELDLSMGGLIEKILSLFNFAPDTEIMLTYIDEDGDSVALVDDDDLHDVVKQALNPLRITVKLNAEKNGTPFARSTGTSTPLRSPRVQQPFQIPNTGVSEILKTIPEPLRETLVKLSTDLASKVSSSAPGISPGVTELVNYFSKVGLSYLDQLSESQTRVRPSTQSDVSANSTFAAETKDSDLSKVDPTTSKVPSNSESEKSSPGNNEIPSELKPETTTKNIEVKVGTVTGGSMEALSSKAPGVTVSRPLNSKNINIGQIDNDYLQDSASTHLKPSVIPISVSKKEKVKVISESNLNEKSPLTFSQLPPAAIHYLGESSGSSVDVTSVANNVPTEKEVNKLSEPHLGARPTIVGTPDPTDTLLVPSPSSFSYFPDSLSGPNLNYECPFSGIPVENISAAPPQPASQAVSFRRSRSQNDGGGTIFHRGVRCDGCGVHPITGPRFKSKVKVDYDLCSICFAAMGNHNDYIRMDHPAVNRHQWSFKGFHDYHARGRCPVLPHAYRGFKVKQSASKLDSRFIQDVNIMDGTIMGPLTPFTKIWRMRNNGTIVWPQKTQLVWIGGDKLSNAFSSEVEIPAAGLAVDQELDIAVDFISPELPGRYISYWRMASPSGQKFGQRVWVLIQVDGTFKDTPHGGVRGLNLNLPPVNSVLTGPEIINIDLEALVEDSRPEPENSKKTMEIVDPVVQTQLPNNEQEMKFPINDSLLVGSGAANSAPAAPSSVSYPIVDLSDMASPAFSPPLPSVLYPPPPTPSVLYPPPPTPSVLYPPPPLPSVLYPPPPPSVLYPPPPPLPPPPPPPVFFPPHSPFVNIRAYAEEFPPLPPVVNTPAYAEELPPLPPVVNTPAYAEELTPLPPVVNTQAYAEGFPGKEEVEKKLLRELEEMGFKQVDLNKEILRMHEYDLEQAVDDLCGVAEWDPILEELQEMGFHDTEMNKKLLKKNNGSIKRVVMDLIAGEEMK